jgi:UDP-2,4-diacetamido-2,4,6-trideoxy-beta-L-altropyranose hydrolase
MNIVFRVDSSKKMGSGHLMRCLTLSKEFKQNHEITFICKSLDGNLISLIKHNNYKVILLDEESNFHSSNIYLEWLGSTQEYDAEETINAIPSNTDLLVVDNYALDQLWHKRLRPYTKKIFVIDDLSDRKFDCDLLLNQNLGVKKENYKNKVSNNCELFLGSNYALLRPEFAKLRNKAINKRKKTKKIKNILITMDGVDKYNQTFGILQELDNNLNIVVVLRSNSPHNSMIKAYAKDKNIQIVIDSINMSKLIFEADLAIGAGGSSSLERCCLGLPTLLYVTSENQKNMAKNLDKIDAVKIVDNLKENLQDILDNVNLWKSMSNSAEKVCDGLGVKRIKL